jgi:hypothetical protein
MNSTRIRVSGRIRLLWLPVTLAALMACAAAVRAEPLPRPHAVPHCFPAAEAARLGGQRASLEQELAAFLEAARAFNTRKAEQQTDDEYAALQKRRAKYVADVKTYHAELDRVVGASAVPGMPAFIVDIIHGHRKLAASLGWSHEKQACLAIGLNRLGFDANHVYDANAASQAWHSMEARGEDAQLAAAARAMGGMKLTGSGTQTNHQDCVVFALATATGRPYGVVAAQAAFLIRNGEWRAQALRADPQQTIEADGLSGGEAVMLAENFGRARVVEPAAFERSLASGETLVVAISPSAGRTDHGHEVVLASAFRHGGRTWFEIVDSSKGPLTRRFASQAELDAMLIENGVAFRPDPGRTPALLR